MNASWLEALILAALLLWSAWVVLGRFLPGLTGWLRAALATTCERRGWSGLARRLQAPAAAAGCGLGCSTCGGCASSDTQIVQLKKSS